MEDIESRTTALEARVDALEASLASREQPAEEPGDFWALVGVRGRAEESGAVMLVGDVALPTGGRAAWQEGLSGADLLGLEWESLADSLAALAHPVRLRIVRLALEGVGTAKELAEHEGMGSAGQVYHHLRSLVAAGWLRNRGGSHVVPVERVVPLLAIVLGAAR